MNLSDDSTDSFRNNFVKLLLVEFFRNLLLLWQVLWVRTLAFRKDSNNIFSKKICLEKLSLNLHFQH